jgi:hypothetical protein
MAAHGCCISYGNRTPGLSTLAGSSADFIDRMAAILHRIWKASQPVDPPYAVLGAAGRRDAASLAIASSTAVSPGSRPSTLTAGCPADVPEHNDVRRGAPLSGRRVAHHALKFRAECT